MTHALNGRSGRAVPAFLLGVLTCLSCAAHAADTASHGFTMTGQAAIASDYIWRGLSQTWGKPAAQLSVTADHASGAYAGFFASNVASQFVPNGTLETDFSLGYKATVGGAAIDVGGVYAYYPGSNFNKASFTPAFDDSAPHTVELYAGATLGALNVRAGYIPTKFYGWNVNNSGVDGVFNGEHPRAGLTGSSKGSYNLEASYTWPLNAAWNVQATVGRQVIPHSRDISWNYGKLGVTGDLGSGWSVGLAASATSKPDAFDRYGSLTNNGQRSDPARTTAIVSLSKAI